MKKIILMAVSVIFITNTVFSQILIEDNRGKMQFGIKGGLNYSNVYDAEGEEFDADAKFGYAFGANLNIPIGNFLGVQPSVMVSQKGFQASGSLLNNNYNFTRTTTFLDVPLLLAIKPINALTILAGPQFSYLLKQRDEFNNSANSAAQEQEFKNDNIRKNIFGGVIGFDVNFNHFTIGARANWDIQTNNGDGTSSTPRYKNAWYQLTLGYNLF